MNPWQTTDPQASMNTCPPLSEEILGEAAELLSFWPAIRNDSRLAPHTAADLLAVWAHLSRFPPTDIAGEIGGRLDRLIHDEKDRLTTLFLKLRPPALGEAIGKLDRAWNHVSTWNASEELERDTRDLFDAIDRQSLAVHALQKLLPAENGRRPDVEELVHNVEVAEQMLLQHAESFYPAASLATAMLEAYRTDLAQFDRALWMTTLKYRRMADLYEEQEVAPDTLFTPGESHRAESENIGETAQQQHVGATPVQSAESQVLGVNAGQEVQEPSLRLYCERAEQHVGKFKRIKEYRAAFLGMAAGTTQVNAFAFPEIKDDVPVVTLWPCRQLVDQAPDGLLRDAWGAYFNCRLFILLSIVRAGANRIGKPRVRSAAGGSGGQWIDCHQLEDVENDREKGLWGHLWLLDPPGESLQHQVFAVPLEKEKQIIAGQLAAQACTLALALDARDAEEPVPPAEKAYNQHPEIRALLGVLGGLPKNRTRETSLASLVDQLAAHRFQAGTAVSQTFAFYAVWVAQARTSPDERLLRGNLAQRLRDAFVGNSSWPTSFTRYIVDLLGRAE